jgi:death on curing protein
MAIALHEESIARFGGTAGLRDVGLLEAALARPKNRHAYDGIEDVPTLAAAYGFAIARNHPFVDGNERAAVLFVAVFAALNGFRFDPDQVDEVATFLSLPEGTIEEPAFAAWVAAQCA